MADLQQEMKARNKVAQSMIEMAELQPMNTQEERAAFENGLKKILMPTFMTNISADELKRGFIEDYIFDASTLLRQAAEKKQRQVNFVLRKEDEDLLPALHANWKDKKIKYEFVESTESQIVIKLSW
jgi:hypothetical protein